MIYDGHILLLASIHDGLLLIPSASSNSPEGFRCIRQDDITVKIIILLDKAIGSKVKINARFYESQWRENGIVFGNFVLILLWIKVGTHFISFQVMEDISF